MRCLKDAMPVKRRCKSCKEIIIAIHFAIPYLVRSSESVES